MRSSPVVKIEIPTNRASCLADGFVGSQIDLLVFDAAPQPLNEHIVPPGPFAIHADGDAVVGKQVGERRTSEPLAVLALDRTAVFVARVELPQGDGNRGEEGT